MAVVYVRGFTTAEDRKSGSLDKSVFIGSASSIQGLDNLVFPNDFPYRAHYKDENCLDRFKDVQSAVAYLYEIQWNEADRLIQDRKKRSDFHIQTGDVEILIGDDDLAYYIVYERDS